MADKIQCCCSCRFWLLADRSMLCRRRAPTRDLHMQACWPQTLPLMYCGEYEPADRSEVERRKSLISKPKESSEGLDIDVDL